MLIYHSLQDLVHIKKPLHLALGVFDGLHRGHHAVIKNAIHAAQKQAGECSGVLTFLEHPKTYLCPENAPTSLFSTQKEKEELLNEWGVDYLIALPFTQKIASLSASEFLHILENSLTLRSISIGTDWQFGKGREGNILFLQQEAAKKHFLIHTIPEILDESGQRISSTSIRKAVKQGHWEKAHKLLGRHYIISGKVIHGQHLASKWGFPTANIELNNQTIPPLGVYFVRVEIEATTYWGVANLGKRPTLQNSSPQIHFEIHLLNFSQDIYGKSCCINFIEAMRTEQRFESINALREQIEQDIKQGYKLLAKWA